MPIVKIQSLYFEEFNYFNKEDKPTATERKGERQTEGESVDETYLYLSRCSEVVASHCSFGLCFDRISIYLK